LEKALKELDISADLEIVRKARVSKPFPNVGLWNEPLSGWEDAVSCPGIIREPWQVHKWGGDAGNLPVPDAPDCPFDRGNRNGISTIVTYDSSPKAIL